MAAKDEKDQDAQAKADAQAQAQADKDAKAADRAQAKADKQAAQDAVDAATGVATVSATMAQSAQAATGDVIKVPDSPDAIAKQGTKLGNSGDVTTGGNVEVGVAGNPDAPKFVRVWGMDNDHTERNRSGFDPLKPDMSVQVG